MIQIKNKHNYNGPGVYVGRPSPLGNPYPLSKYTRAEGMTLYGEWLAAVIRDGKSAPAMLLKELVAEFEATGNLVLICWCYPKPCHADIIASNVIRIAKLGGWK